MIVLRYYQSVGKLKIRNISEATDIRILELFKGSDSSFESKRKQEKVKKFKIKKVIRKK